MSSESGSEGREGGGCLRLEDRVGGSFSAVESLGDDGRDDAARDADADAELREVSSKSSR